MSEVQQEHRELELAGYAEETGGASSPSVGQRLRAAREAAGLTTADVARSLKYSPRQVEQLEADDHAALPGNTIVRGFTRSYARLLGLDAEELLQLLGGRAPNAFADVRAPDNMGLASAPGGLRQLSLTAAAAIVVTLAALLIALWQFLGPVLPKTAPVTEKKPVPMPVQAVVPAADTAVPAAASPPSGVADSQADVATLPAAATPSAPRNAQADVAALLFVFEGRSWLEVSDGAKQKLYTGENLAGSRLTLGGKPPFDIVVGNAGKVRLTYGEREIDLAPHTRAEVARLKLE